MSTLLAEVDSLVSSLLWSNLAPFGEERDTLGRRVDTLRFLLGSDPSSRDASVRLVSAWQAATRSN